MYKNGGEGLLELDGILIIDLKISSYVGLWNMRSWEKSSGMISILLQLIELL